MNILGISYAVHESSACIVKDGELQFACAEERLSKKKLDGGFPFHAIDAALEYAGLSAKQIDHVAIGWDAPGAMARNDFRLMATGQMPLSTTRVERSGLSLIQDFRHRGGKKKYIARYGAPREGFHYINHHVAHALSAYCLSGFDESAIMVVDGRGVRESTTLWKAVGDNLTLVEQYDFPNSLGVFYAGITYMLGFQPLSDEWKVMGLAAYGNPTHDLSKLIKVTESGYRVDGKKFFGTTDLDLSKLEAVLGKRRSQESLSQDDKDVARSAQDICEKALFALLRKVTQSTGSRNLCISGGVGLNCKANGELLRSGMIDQIYIQPAAGDDGCCIGAAFGVYRQLGKALPRKDPGHSYFGTEHSNEAIEKVLSVYKLDYERVADPSYVAAKLLSQGALIGWFQGRMEFGPRALGNRSILSDPRFVENRDKVNDAVKFRENWRPFAPSVLEEKGHLYFKDFVKSPYMILSFWATDLARKEIPAVVHIDGSCRVQSVTEASNAKYYSLLKHFEKLTGVGAVMNTSFNLKGDAIVESPKDAVQTFFTSGLDFLVIGDFLVRKKQGSFQL